MHFQRSKSFLESPKSVFNAFVQVIAWFVVIFRNCFTQFHEPLNLRQFWNITSGIYAKYHVQIMLLFVYTTTHKRFVIFTCRYFKLSGNTTALSQSNCRIFSCSSMNEEAVVRYSWEFSAHPPVHIWRQPVFGTSFFHHHLFSAFKILHVKRSQLLERVLSCFTFAVHLFFYFVPSRDFVPGLSRFWCGYFTVD